MAESRIVRARGKISVLDQKVWASAERHGSNTQAIMDETGLSLNEILNRTMRVSYLVNVIPEMREIAARDG